MKKFIYSDKKRQKISFPLGGIGTGCIGLLGNGALGGFEIKNRPDKHSTSNSFFAIKAERNGQLLDARILQSELELSISQKETFVSATSFRILKDYPHFPKCDFESYFPFAQLNFACDSFPATIKMKAFNPFIPLNDTDSGIPAAFFEFEVYNSSDKKTDYTLCGILENLLPNCSNTAGCTENGEAYIYMDNSTELSRDKNGNMCISTNAKNVSYQEYLYRSSLFDTIKKFWDDFTLCSTFVNRSYDDKSSSNSSAALATHFSLEPNEVKTIRFLISWYFPYASNYFCPVPKKMDESQEDYVNKNSWRNYYAQYFESSVECSSYCFRHWDRLKNESMMFSDTLLCSTLPDKVLEAVTNNLCVFKSPAILRLDDGCLWELDCSENEHGTFSFSCSHIWNYAYSLSFLFPKLERSMTLSQLKYCMDDYGGINSRLLPKQRKHFEDNAITNDVRFCADVQLGIILKSYRNFKLWGDDEQLIENWYEIAHALDYCFSPDNPYGWDTSKSGVMSGLQHNCLDTFLFSPNSRVEGMYLAALKAGYEMASIVKDKKRAETYLDLFNKGKKWTEENLFNGKYYCQKIDLTDKSLFEKSGIKAIDDYYSSETGEIKYQIGEGSSIDQLLGQWHADLMGLGEIFDKDRIDSAVNTLYEVNCKNDLRTFENCSLVSYCQENGGCVMCAYPDTVKVPEHPVPHADEYITGLEYEAAQLMLMHEKPLEALRLIEAIRNRFDGEHRNPFFETENECDYPRSMSSYALLVSLSGFEYDAYKKHIGFNPLSDHCPLEIGNTFRCFFCVEDGYGYVEEGIDYIEINMVKGKLDITSFAVPRTPRLVQYGGRNWRFTDSGLCATLDTNLVVTPDKKLTILIDIKPQN
ncbi:MAG: hypothetical protein J6K12_05150 [Clostridia bacterium]|nr:hypothetical protein [Clostridia bacterium]